MAPLIGADDVAAVWKALTMSQQRAEIQALVTITVQPPERGRWLDVKDRVTFAPASQSAVAA